MMLKQAIKSLLYTDGLVQKRRNSIANTLELHLSCTKPLILDQYHGSWWPGLYASAEHQLSWYWLGRINRSLSFMREGINSLYCIYFFLNAVLCHYNMVNFLPNPHNRHSIAHPLGWDMGCLLWIYSLMYIQCSGVWNIVLYWTVL